MGRYPNEICPGCKKNHRKGKDKFEKRNQQTFYYEAHLSNQSVKNEYRWKTYRCIDCNMVVMFIEHVVKDIEGVNDLVNSIAVNLIRFSKPPG